MEKKYIESDLEIQVKIKYNKCSTKREKLPDAVSHKKTAEKRCLKCTTTLAI